MMNRLWSMCALVVLGAAFGCEREKRVEVPESPSSTAEIESGAADSETLFDAEGWLAHFGRDADSLAKFAESSSLWGALLQGRYIDVLTEYDALRKPSEIDGLACARASLELASTALVLEALLKSVQTRVLEIQGSRGGVEVVAPLRSFFEAQSQSEQDLSIPVWDSVRPTFLASTMGVNALEAPATSTYRGRWALLSKLRNGETLLTTERFLKRVQRLSGPDFEAGTGDATFEFIDLSVAGLTRQYFARKALQCMGDQTPALDLLRVRGLRLSGKKAQAIKVLKAHKVPDQIPMGIQLLTLETSVAGYEQALLVESAALGLDATGFNVTPSASVPFASIRTGLVVGLGHDEGAKKLIAVRTYDPVLLTRTILKQLKIGPKADETTTATLIARYVDEILRKTADIHFLKGEFARSAQVRRRIGGTDAFTIGPKVPPSALAKCALEHWKIVEPRSAIRYLKELATIFPNAKRSAGLLRDVLSYRARQSGGQTAAGQ